ncbi:MAG: hypothetical protein CK430_06135 [Legionella sp.]|nr:MAG: hypothetical protein CK430_06135 [Legionella sp.]
MNELNSKDNLKDPKDRITCRVAAGGRKDVDYSESFSLTPWVDGDIIVNLELAAADKYAIKINKEKMTVKIKPGPQIKALDEILEAEGLATVSPASLINRVTPFGLAANGGHGTDIRAGAYTDNIESLTFLKMDGETVTISRKTHPDDFDLIASTHFGLYGMAVKMKLRCKPAEKLRRIERSMSLPEFIKAVEDGKLPRPDFPMFSWYYVPTYADDLNNPDIKNVKVIEYQSVPWNTENKNFDPETKHIEQWLQVELEEGLRVTDVLAMFPELTPLFMKYIVARYAVGDEEIETIGPASALYHYQTEYPRRLNDLDGMFPVSDDLHEMIDAVKKIAMDTEDAKKDNEAPVTFGAYGRLVQNKQYKASLSPSSHHCDKKLTCGLDIVSSPGAVGFEKFRDNFVTYLIEVLKAKLHWGKYVPLDKGINYNEMYGDDLKEYKRVLKQFHKDNKLDLERSPFLTDFPSEVLDMKDKYRPTVEKVPTGPELAAAAHSGFRLRGLKCFLNWIAEQNKDHESDHIDELKTATHEFHQTEMEKIPEFLKNTLFGNPVRPNQTRGCPTCVLI